MFYRAWCCALILSQYPRACDLSARPKGLQISGGVMRPEMFGDRCSSRGVHGYTSRWPKHAHCCCVSFIDIKHRQVGIATARLDLDLPSGLGVHQALPSGLGVHQALHCMAIFLLASLKTART